VPKVSATGERSLFFTHRTNEEHWRLTEKVAAVLEGNFVGSPEKMFTFSTVNVPNGTPYPLPLDVVFALTPDPLSAFAFVQVKDYSEDKIHREYIDAVIGQRVQTGIKSCTVVSTMGFTRDALALATAQGVRLRILTSNANLPYNGYLPENLGIHMEPYFLLQEAVLILTGPKGVAQPLIKKEELYKRNLIVEDHVVTVNDLFNRALQDPDFKLEVNQKLEKDHNIRIVNIGQDIQKLNARVKTTDGIVTVSGIAYHAEVIHPRALESKVTRYYVYHDPLKGANLAWCVIADFQLVGLEAYDLPDALYHYCLWRFPNGESDSVGGAFFPA
jgi:hypothetical protein